MTHEGTLFTVHKTKIQLSGDPPCDSWFERIKPIRVPGLWAIPVEGDWAEEKAEIERLRAHWISAVDLPAWYDQGTYIALDPDLRIILEAPFRSKLRDIENHVHQEAGYRRRVEKLLLQEVTKAAALTARISDFRALPWWRRVWVALRGAV